MLAKASGLMGAMVVVALVVVSLWGWGAAPGLVQRAEKPELALWAVRSAAIAALAAAQAIGLATVVGLFYRPRAGGRDRAGELAGMTAGIVCTLALISAVGLGIVSSR